MKAIWSCQSDREKSKEDPTAWSPYPLNIQEEIEKAFTHGSQSILQTLQGRVHHRLQTNETNTKIRQYETQTH